MPIGLDESIDLDRLDEAGTSSVATGLSAPVEDGATVDSATPSPIPLDLPEDGRFGHFRVVGRLGRGGMGDVYRALDESLQRFVALKVLRPSEHGGLAGSVGPMRLLQEARAQARVNHPGVVHIYYVSQDPQQPFLAMELVPGTTLSDRLRSGPLPYARTIDIALQISRALRQAARYDVVHGDIKPGNILLAPDGGVKLSDFGLARRLSGKRTGPAGPITGTPHYIPPEVIAGKESDIRGDMYALGVMLFEMTFGRRPYTIASDRLRDQIEAHRAAPVEFPEQWPLDLPEGWRDVLAKLLQKDPAERYQSHDELIAVLERLKPVDLPRAGRVARLLAWGIDVFLAIAAELLLLAPFGILAARGLLPESTLPSLLITATISAFVLAVAAIVQAHWKTSPGKALFQLRIVDRHGLSPTRMALGTRAIFQLLPMWGTDVQDAFSNLGAEPLALIAATATVAIVLADAAFALVRRDGRSLHDLLLRTRVALDTRTAPNTL
ncbi:MAG: protein kinase [Planctomycetaceae bacterium]|nr:protein kinase [Planctomycetaceae bacterium]